MWEWLQIKRLLEILRRDNSVICDQSAVISTPRISRLLPHVVPTSCSKGCFDPGNSRPSTMWTAGSKHRPVLSYIAKVIIHHLWTVWRGRTFKVQVQLTSTQQSEPSECPSWPSIVEMGRSAANAKEFRQMFARQRVNYSAELLRLCVNL